MHFSLLSCLHLGTETGSRKRKTKTSPSSSEKKVKQDHSEQDLNLKTAEISLPRLSLDKLPEHVNNVKDKSHKPQKQMVPSSDEEENAEPQKPLSPLHIKDDDPLLNRITVKSSHSANGQVCMAQCSCVTSSNTIVL